MSNANFGPKTSPTGYWTFMCNPKKWQIDDYLASGSFDDFYRITPWQAEWFDLGQLGVVRVGVDSRSKRVLGSKNPLTPGVYGIVEVTSKPVHNVPDDPYWLEPQPESSDRLSVGIRYHRKLLDAPVLLNDLKADPTVSDPYLLNGFQTASMPLAPASFERVLALSGGDLDVSEAIIAIPCNTTDAIASLEMKYAGAAPQIKEVVSRRIERGSVAEAVKQANDYKCQICEVLGLTPIGFITLSGRPYVEVHHVTFVSKLDPGSLGPSNIITVCANHHRQLHYGDVALIASDASDFVFRIDDLTVTISRVTMSRDA